MSLRALRHIVRLAVAIAPLCAALSGAPIHAGERASLSKSSTDDSFPEYLVDFWSTEDGLPSNTVTGIAQTPDGYLWCATHDGLVRFDGVRFLRVGPDDPVNQQANRLLCIHVDGRGQLWIGSDGGGLMRYENGAFTTFIGANLSFNTVRCIADDVSGDLWFGTRGGLGRIKDGRVTWMTEANGFTNAANSIWNTAFDKDGHLWVADWVSLRTFRSPTFQPHTLPEQTIPVRALYVDRSSNLWVGMLGRVWRRDAAGEWSGNDASARLANAEVVTFCEDRAGDIWVGTRKGLRKWRSGRWVRGANRGLGKTEVRALFEDREGNLWVGTGTAGLARLKRRVLTTYAAREGLTDEGVLALRETPEGGLLAGSSDGRLFEGVPGAFRQEPTALKTEAPVQVALRARDGALWIGTFGDGLMRVHYDEVTRYLPTVGTFARIDKITALLEDRRGNLLAGSYYGLYRVAGSNVMTSVPIGGRELRSHITALLEDRAGALWIASHGLGVARVLHNDVKWLTRRDGLPTDLIRTLHEDDAGTVWIGTSAGLCSWSNGKLDVFTKAHGLVDETISQILEDADGNLWLGSNRGIMRIAKRELRAVSEGRKATLDVFACGRGEGMLSAECSGGFFPAGLKTSDGKLWFPTAKGLVMVDPAELKLKTNPNPPPVHIEEVWADGKRLNLECGDVSPPSGSAVLESKAATRRRTPKYTVLPYDTRRLEFIYTALSFTAPERVRFKHRLQGFDSDWTDAGTARSAVYTKLPPDDYRFQVIACNNDGVWNQIGQTHAFRIDAPFWQRWWFLSLAGIATASGLGAMVRVVSVRHLHRKLERLEEAHAVEKERMRIAQDMHDEIGGKLSRISFLSDMASRNVPEASEASQQIDQVSETAREVIRTVDEIVWAVSPRNDTFESLAHYICRHAEEFFEMTPVDLELDLPTEFPAHRLPAEVRHNLFCAVKEALNNVFKHAQATRVRIGFAVRPTFFEVAVTDNGVGFDSEELLVAAQSNGNPRRKFGDGLLNMQERLESISGRCTVESQPTRGARVVFTVPLKSL